MNPADLPTEWANYISMAGFLLLAGLIWLIPKKLIFSEAKDHSKWRDIRVWATELIIIQLGIYSIFI